jgi:hypothetical protein
MSTVRPTGTVVNVIVPVPVKKTEVYLAPRMVVVLPAPERAVTAVYSAMVGDPVVE